jgi:hypothetical protein
LDELSKQGFVEMDPSTLKRTYNEFKVRLMARDVGRNLFGDKPGDLFLPTKTRK